MQIFLEKGGGENGKNFDQQIPLQTWKMCKKLCPLCEGGYGNLKVPCSTNNTGYRWSCKTCKEKNNLTKVYEGETSRSLRIRSMEHIKAFQNKKSNSVLYKHKLMDHINEEVEFEVEITGIFKDALSRQANESVRIYSRKKSEILNSKSEFNHPPTARVMVEKKHRSWAWQKLKWILE